MNPTPAVSPRARIFQTINNRLRFFLQAQRVTVVSVSPLVVALRSGTTIPAIRVKGLSYAVGDAGVALTAERGQAIVLPID